MLKNSLIAFVLTALISVVAAFIVGSDTYLHSDFVILAFLLVAIFGGIPNVVFLLLMHYLKISREILPNIKYLILEIIVLNIIGFTISKLLLLVPSQYRFERTAGTTSLKIYFNPTFEMLYTFIVLFIVLLLIKKIFGIGKTSSHQTDN